MKLSRRDFNKTVFLGASSTVLSMPLRAKSANDRVNVAVVGLGNKGNGLVNDAMRTERARLVALCEVDSNRLEKAAARVEKEFGVKVDTYKDLRAVLDRKDVDAVVLATPNHWHALQTILACQARKDVYVEKPVCHTLWEGIKMQEAARKYGRIVQSGLQNRSDPGLQEAFQWIHAGNLGKITLVRSIVYDNRTSIGKRDTPLVPPDSCDYNLWLGPARDELIYRSRFHYDWHWDWNTGNGDFGNQGIHELDLARWVMGDPGHPESVFSYGGRFAWNDAGETPNMQNASFAWKGRVPLIFELRNLWVDPETNAAENYKGRRMGLIVSCEEGELRCGRGGGMCYDLKGKRIRSFKGDSGLQHFPAFINAVLTRKQSDVACTLEDGYLSSCLAHLANASYLTGRLASRGEVADSVAGDALMAESHDRLVTHLNRWEGHLNGEPWTLGRRLGFDPRAERFTEGGDASAANELLRRDYRSSFEVPEII